MLVVLCPLSSQPASHLASWDAQTRREAFQFRQTNGERVFRQHRIEANRNWQKPRRFRGHGPPAPSPRGHVPLPPSLLRMVRMLRALWAAGRGRWPAGGPDAAPCQACPPLIEHTRAELQGRGGKGVSTDCAGHGLLLGSSCNSPQRKSTGEEGLR